MPVATNPVRERVLLGFIAGLAALSATLVVWQAIEPIPWRFGGLVINRLTSTLSLLVASVGAVTFRFAMRYLDGDPRRDAFLARLAFTVASAYALMLASHLGLLFTSWLLTSLGLHTLLTHDSSRRAVHPPARKKFLISRLGDLALISAIAVIAITWHTLDLETFLAAAGRRDVSNEHALTAVGMLIALAALTKSAQFPFHSWLPETMEAPTPVSALMHAGIINAGGALLLRFAPVIARVPLALVVLATIGTLTTLLGMLAMWSQINVKRTLAWSTVAQMGFMMIQCGLAAFPAAFLHILGHGLYKAWSFLRSGELAGQARSTSITSPSPSRTLALVALGASLSVPAMFVARTITGFDPANSPGEITLAGVVALSIGQLWAALLPPSLPRMSVFRRTTAALAATASAALFTFALYHSVTRFLDPVLGHIDPPTGFLAWVAAAVPLIGLAVLTVIHALLPAASRFATARAFYVHALNGFYLGAIADRLVDGLWTRIVRIKKEVQHV